MRGHLASASDPDVALLAAAFAALDDAAGALVGALVQRILPRLTARLEARKREAGLYDFQDMLTLVARGLEGDGPRQQTLLAGLRARYKYALIDEFQDTDEVQWSIFRRIFFASRRPRAHRDRRSQAGHLLASAAPTCTPTCAPAARSRRPAGRGSR